MTNTDDSLSKQTQNLSINSSSLSSSAPSTSASGVGGRYVPPSRRNINYDNIVLPSSTSRVGSSRGAAAASPSSSTSSAYSRPSPSSSSFGDGGSGSSNGSFGGYNAGSGSGGSSYGNSSSYSNNNSNSSFFKSNDSRSSSAFSSTSYTSSDSRASSYNRSTTSGQRDAALELELFGAVDRMKTGINFDKYADIPSSVSGRDCPDAITEFASAGLHPLIAENVNLAHYSSPTPVQKYSIPTVLANRDLMACAQTGSGKTAAFLVPIISSLMAKGQRSQPQRYGGGYQRTPAASPQALVLAPTRELALQIYEESKKFAYRSWCAPCVAYGGAEKGQQLREMRRGCEILIATPGRLSDFIAGGAVSMANIKFLVLDEADRMLDMGFEPQIRQIVEGSDMPGIEHRRTLMFSATFPREIQALAGDFMNDYVFLSVGRVGSTSENITQTILNVEDNEKKSLVLDILRANPTGLTLVFVETKRNAEYIDDYLYNQGFASTSIHGDRTQIQREAALKAFRAGECSILVATAVAARGLDIPNVTHVINYDLPGDIDDYVHRIGRTGRAGNTGLATSFFAEKNCNIRKDLIEILEEAKQDVPSWLKSIGSYGGGGSGGRPDFSRGRGGSSGGRFGGTDHRKDSGFGGGNRGSWGGAGNSSSSTQSVRWG